MDALENANLVWNNNMEWKAHLDVWFDCRTLVAKLTLLGQ